MVEPFPVHFQVQTVTLARTVPCFHPQASVSLPCIFCCTVQIGALKDIRNDMSTIKAQLFNKVLDELQLHLYNKGKYR